MKNMNLKHFYTGVLLLLTCVFASCSKKDGFDIVGDGTNRVFFNTENYTVNNYNNFVFPVIHTPTGSLGNIQATFPVRSTQTVDNDVSVTYAVDYSLVESYNANRGTQYLRLPDGFLTLGSQSLTIPRGQVESSEMVNLSVPANKLAQLTAPAYLVPIKITTISGDGNTQISANQNTAYLVIRTTVTNLYNGTVLADMTGSTLIASRTGWTATVTPSTATTAGSFANLFDARTNTNWQASNWLVNNVSKPLPVTFDMASTRNNISGIRIHTNSTTYALTSVGVSTSTNGVDWVSQGVTAPSIASSYQYFKFYSPVSARYIRLDVQASRNVLMVLTEFDVYTAN